MKTLKIITCLAAFVTGLGLLPSQGSVVYGGLTWYDSGAASSLTVSSGTMTSQNTSPTGNFALAYLPSTLSAISGPITLTVDFSKLGNGASSNNVRLGLFYSGGMKISADNIGLTSGTYANYTGYTTAFDNQGLASNRITDALWARTGSNSALISTSTPFTQNASTSENTGSTPALTSGTPYIMTLTLTYISPTSMTVSSSLSGGALGTTITRSYNETAPTTNFDTIVLYSGTSAATGLNFTSVSVIPEPSTRNSLVAVLAVSIFGVYVCHRRRRLRGPGL